jgi:uncharacterized protein
MPVLCRLSYSSGMRQTGTTMIRVRGRPRHALALIVLLASCGGDPAVEGLPRGTLVIESSGGPVRVDVEIAETPEARSRGLMGREDLAPAAGMVFLEDEPVRQGFWMKDTTIPLSLAVWGEDGRIADILDMDPCTGNQCPSYTPDAEWVGALEVNQGFFDARGVEVGDRVRLERAG